MRGALYTTVMLAAVVLSCSAAPARPNAPGPNPTASDFEHLRRIIQGQMVDAQGL